MKTDWRFRLEKGTFLLHVLIARHTLDTQDPTSYLLIRKSCEIIRCAPMSVDDVLVAIGIRQGKIGNGDFVVVVC